MRGYSILPQTLAAVAASMTLLCTGFHYGWPTPSIAHLNFEDTDLSTTMQHISWIISIINFGCVGGVIPGLILVDTLGRKVTLLLATIPFVFSSVLLAFARAYWLFYIARFVAGIGIGVSLTVAPMYIGEIAEGRIRGGLCVLMPMMVLIGTIVPIVIGPHVARAALGIIGAVIPIAGATSLLWMPESPYYCSMKTNPNGTRRSVAWLRGTSDVAREVQEIDDSMAINRRRGAQFLSLFTVLSNRKALLAIVVMVIADALSGPQIMSIYIYRLISISSLPINPNIAFSLISLGIPLVSIIGVAFLVDKVGRRPLLLVSSSLCVVFLLTEALLDKLGAGTSDWVVLRWLPLVGFIGFIISHAIGLGTVPIVVAAEIFPCEAKALGLAINMAFRFIILFASAHICNFLIFNLDGYIGLCIVAAGCLISTILIYFLVPETKGRSLSEIQVGFQGHIKPLI